MSPCLKPKLLKTIRLHQPMTNIKKIVSLLPPIPEEAVLEVNVSVPDPPAQQVEVENVEAATTNTSEANDVVMAETNVEPAPTNVHEANDAPVVATAPVPPPRPYTIEQAYNHGKLITVRWPVLVPPPNVSGPQFDYHVEHRPQVQKPKPRLSRFPGTATSVGSFNANGFKSHNTFFDSSKNPYTKPRISSDRFWSHQ